ncbi:MAG: CocE/NonD family hydrolase [Acidimicrobiales bacterium]
MTLASRFFGSLAKLPPATTGDISVERDLPTKMSDGATLFADRWYPTSPGMDHAPIILMRTPYGRRQWGMIGRLFAERGYQVVIQSCRGTFGSGGNWTPLRHEEADGRETLDWVAGQPWFDGKLATFGPSYLGLTQWAIAQGAPEYLRAIALTVTASNFHDAAVYPSGCLALETALTWLYQVEHQERGWRKVVGAQLTSRRALREACAVLPLADADASAVGHHVQFFQDWIIHENPGDTWWDLIEFGRQLGTVPPASLVGGWYDIFLPFQVDDFQALRAAGRSATLTIGPWSHVSPGVFAASLRDGLKLFDGQFSDPPSAFPHKAVRVFVMGARRWVEMEDWPPPFVEQRWYLGAAGKLHRSPSPGTTPDRYRYDPANPTPGIGGPSLNWGNAGRKDQKKREDRADVLTYTSEVLTEDLTVIGPLRAELHARTSLEHTDFFVRLCDVSPRGRSENLSDGIIRLRPGDVTKSGDGSFSVRISMWPTANTFRRGHRVRLQVSSGAHPLFVRNTGTDEPLASATRLSTANQEIFHDADHRSAVVLPVSPL